MFGEKIRYYGFLLTDFIKGNKNKKNLNELNHLWGNSSRTKKDNEEKISSLLDFATTNTAFYKKFEGKININDFPIIEKKDIRENQKSFVSQGFKKEDLIKVTTSGSYGTPFTFFLTKEKKMRQFSEVLFFSNWIGYKIGKKHILMGAKERSKIALFKQNKIFLKPSVMDEAWLEEQRNILLTKNVKIIIGYPSVVKALAEYCRLKEHNQKDFSLEGIIVTSEPLYEETRDLAQSIFGCPVVGRYATEELGVIAHECISHKNYHINNMNYIVEVLDINGDFPVKNGEVGRIVVTDLYSHAMPLIRYDTGDLAVLGEDCNCGVPGKIFEKIEGRRIELIYNTSGIRVSPFSINSVMRDIDKVLQFQFIQKEEKKYQLKLVVQNDFPKTLNEEILNERLTSILGKDAVVELQYLKSIEALKSGKRPYILSEYIKT